MKAHLVIRREEAADYRRVEELTRDAFWDVNVPGCDEHYLAHVLRKAEAFIPDLDFVACLEGKIAGNIMYARAVVRSSDGKEHPVLTFGPLSVDPVCQNQGIGGSLVRHSVEAARALGYNAVIIYGDPDYYQRFGFRAARGYGIHTPYNTYSPALQVLELYPGALEGISGVFEEGEIYHLDEAAAQEFDRGFPKREKGWRKSQQRFQEILAASVPV